MEPMLIMRRTGRTIAIVLAAGFGGGTMLLGLASALASALRAGALWPALWGYFLAALPFFLAGAVLAMCRRELWFVPQHRAFRMLTYRPWRLGGPRVEQASVDEYRGLCVTEQAAEGEDAASLQVVALITSGGDRVALRAFAAADEARAFVDRLADVSGLPARAADEGAAAETPAAT